MHVISSRHLDGGFLERHFTLDEIPGILWTPPASPGAVDPVGPPRGAGRHVSPAGWTSPAGFGRRLATASIERPGSGDRPRSVDAEHARADLRQALVAGEPVDEIVDRLILPLVDQAAPEWQTTLDTLLALPEVRGPVGFSGGVLAIAIRLALVEPRIEAAGLFAGSFVPRSMFEEARQVTIPVYFLLQWDDRGNDRDMALDLFDAFGSTEKTLQATWTDTPESLRSRGTTLPGSSPDT